MFVVANYSESCIFRYRSKHRKFQRRDSDNTGSFGKNYNNNFNSESSSGSSVSDKEIAKMVDVNFVCFFFSFTVDLNHEDCQHGLGEEARFDKSENCFCTLPEYSSDGAHNQPFL